MCISTVLYVCTRNWFAHIGCVREEERESKDQSVIDRRSTRPHAQVSSGGDAERAARAAPVEPPPGPRCLKYSPLVHPIRDVCIPVCAPAGDVVGRCVA